MKKVILFWASRPSPPLELFTRYPQGPPVVFFCKILVVLFLVTGSILGAQPGNPGQGNIPTGGNGQGNQGNQGNGPSFGGGSITLAPGQNPNSLIPRFARTANRLSSQRELTLSDLLILRSILLDRIGYGGREIGLWAEASGNSTKEANTSRVTTGSMIAALDHRFCDHFILGMAGGYNHTKSDDLSANAGWGGVYGIAFSGGWYINQTAIGGGDGFTTTRNGFGGVAKANGAGWFFSEITQGGYNKTFGNLTVGPFCLLQYALSGNPSFSENGSNAPVTVQGGSNSSLVSDLGFDASYSIKKVTLKVSAAWEHEYKDTTTFTTVNLVSIPQASTSIAGTSLGHDSAVVSAGISYQLTERVSVSLGYNGQLGRRNYESNSVTGSIRIGL